jgi:Flp pilus assembly protein TadG
MKFKNTTNGNSSHRRRGVAATEFAVTLPIIMLMILAMIESCSMIFLKQSLTVASYEGIRTALIENAAGDDVRLTCQQVLDDRRIQGGTITIQPADFESLAPGEYVQVTVTAPADLNSVIPGNFFRGRTLTGTATMMKEF